MVIPLASCFFFYGLTMEGVLAINLYEKLMTLLVVCMIGHPMFFMLSIIALYGPHVLSIMAFYETPVFE